MSDKFELLFLFCLLLLFEENKSKCTPLRGQVRQPGRVSSDIAQGRQSQRGRQRSHHAGSRGSQRRQLLRN